MDISIESRNPLGKTLALFGMLIEGTWWLIKKVLAFTYRNMYLGFAFAGAGYVVEYLTGVEIDDAGVWSSQTAVLMILFLVIILGHDNNMTRKINARVRAALEHAANLPPSEEAKKRRAY